MVIGRFHMSDYKNHAATIAAPPMTIGTVGAAALPAPSWYDRSVHGRRRAVNRIPERAFLAVVLAVALSAAACGRQIGDDCQTAVDCDPSGTRICDLSQPGGYCTILGCNETTCPSEATCVRNFPAQFLTTPCNPFCEDRACGTGDGGSDAGCPLVCPLNSPPGSPADSCPNGPTNDCTADEICLDEGLCAPRSSEMRFCAKVCASNSDCRSGYICRQTGTAGSVVLSATPCIQTAFCSPAP
jgi:hypothetical protein